MPTRARAEILALNGLPGGEEDNGAGVQLQREVLVVTYKANR